MNEPFQPQETAFLTYPAGGWRKAMFKWPIQLWRLGLGPLIGRYLMLITHTGRKSGQPRRTLVEYHEWQGRKYAPCAFGPRAQWYKNIAADPRVTIQTAAGAAPMLARRVTDPAELTGAVRHIQQRNPAMTNAYLATLGIQPDLSDLAARKERVYIITFDPTDEPTPPPLPADLAWLWLVAALLPLLLLRGRRPGKREEATHG